MSDSRPLSFLGSFGGTTHRDSTRRWLNLSVVFRTAVIVTKEEPNRHYHAITSVNPRDPYVKKA